MKKYICEAIATAIIVLVGAGSAAFGIDVTPIQIGLAFTISVVLLAYTVGAISGGHGNPSITLGHYFAGKMDLNETMKYIISQFVGAIIAGAVLFSANGFSGHGGLGSNGLGSGVSAISGGIFEVAITFIFVTIILHVTSNDGLSKIAGLIIALALGTLVYIALPITGGSLNAARSFGVAIFAGGSALSQIWIFLIFPAIGGILSGILFKISR